MQQQIEKLKEEREKLTVEFQTSRTEYKSEINRINRAIKIFEKGMNELHGIIKPKRQKSSSQIEAILSETGPLHIKRLCEKLNERGIPMSLQSLSGLMQLYSKSGKMFTKTAPATFGLLELDPVVKSETSAELNSANNSNTAAKKKPSNKPNANVQTNSKVNGGNEPEAAPAETIAEKQTIIYEVEESEAGENGNGEY
ncbi:MAG: hypothetical protein LUM44_07675 [Pyrinomonadaceae bacterium]|nr:hypothetical protein [Pyrinomonadaceae bacterium]